MGLKSRNKGKVGEREAVAFLKSLGFDDAQRTQQYNGLGKSDIICPESLPNVHIEVKYGYDRNAFDVGTARFEQACATAEEEAEGRPWVVLWRPKRCSEWRATWEGCGMWLTTYGTQTLSVLRMLNETKL